MLRNLSVLSRVRLYIKFEQTLQWLQSSKSSSRSSRTVCRFLHIVCGAHRHRQGIGRQLGHIVFSPISRRSLSFSQQKQHTSIHRNVSNLACFDTSRCCCSRSFGSINSSARPAFTETSGSWPASVKICFYLCKQVSDCCIFESDSIGTGCHQD